MNSKHILSLVVILFCFFLCGWVAICGDDDDSNGDDEGNDDTSNDDTSDDNTSDDNTSDDNTSDDDMSDDDTGDDDATDDDDTTGETVWTDPTTGLMWQNGATVGSTNYLWANAKNHCAGLSWGGYSGWRLPDIDELRSLIRGCAATDTGGSCGVTDSCLNWSCWNDSCESCSTWGGPGPNGEYWPPEISGTPVIYAYWSSSRVPVSDSVNGAWGVDFHLGWISSFAVDVGPLPARCVRP